MKHKIENLNLNPFELDVVRLERLSTATHI